MFALSTQHKLKLLSIALAVPISLFLTLTAVLDLPTAQAEQHVAHQPSVPGDAASVLTMPADGVDVSIVDFTFSPAVITITAGSVVTWTNLGSFAHTTTSDAGSLDPWNSGSLVTNGTLTKTFNIPGVYGYHCAIHLGMQGTVIVLAPPLPPQPPLTIDMAGPSSGVADIPHPFTATVSPITTTQPITYIWEATGQTIVTHTDKGLSDTLALAWPTVNTGLQVITVTAVNSAGSVSATHTTIIVPPPVAGVTDVSIVDYAFEPQAVTITVGSSVRWINTGSTQHTTTSTVGDPESWNSGILNPGEVFTKTFNIQGVYAYHCAIHPDMIGTVTVLTQVYLPLVLR